MYQKLLSLKNSYNEIRESIENAYNDVIKIVAEKSEIVNAVFARHPEFKNGCYSGLETMRNYDASLRLLEIARFNDRGRRHYYCPDDYVNIGSVFIFDDDTLEICVGCEWEWLNIPKEILDLEGDELEAYIEKTIVKGVEEFNKHYSAMQAEREKHEREQLLDLISKYGIPEE